MSTQSTPIEVFYSYAHEDKALRDELEKHLSILQRLGLISSWHDRQIVAGQDWAKAIDAHLETASLILLLVSSDFLASDYCYGIEMKRALERHQANEARVIPILVRPVDWHGAPFGHLQVLPTDARSVTEWENVDAAFRNIARGIRRAIEERTRDFITVPSSSCSGIWMIPYRQNPFFTGREPVLQHLYQQLHASSIAAVTQTQAIHGLGGIGKTQVAVEYAYRYRHDYRCVFWIVAASRDTLIADVASIADLLRLPRADEADVTMALAAFKRWLTTSQGWLLILDNADDLAVVSDLLPSTTSGHILITTRAHTLGSLAHALFLEQMTEEEGPLLLLRRAGRLTSDASFAQVSSEEREQAQAIVQALGGLPLALDQAGAYIEETQCTLASYLESYKDLLQRRGQFATEYPASVLTTWSLTFDKIELEHLVAADLLFICAFLAPEDIPEEFFLQGADHLGPILAQALLDRRSLDAAIEKVLKFSLIQRNPSTGAVSIHRLVQVVLKGRMDQETQDAWTMRAVQAMSSVFPELEVSTWPLCRRLLLHAQHCITFIEQHRWTFLEARLLLKRAGHYLSDHAQYQEAKHLYQHVLTVEEEVLGTNHPDTATTLNNLGILYRDQGRYSEAENYYQRALTIREQVLGTSRPDTASTLNNLGRVYSDQGRYTEAEKNLRRALAIQEQVLGASHPDTAATLNNLGRMYRERGRYREAETCYQRTLVVYQQVFVSNHYAIGYVLEEYAFLLLKKGHVLRAARTYRKALKAVGIRKALLDFWEGIRIYTRRLFQRREPARHRKGADL